MKNYHHYNNYYNDLDYNTYCCTFLFVQNVKYGNQAFLASLDIKNNCLVTQVWYIPIIRRRGGTVIPVQSLGRQFQDSIRNSITLTIYLWKASPNKS